MGDLANTVGGIKSICPGTTINQNSGATVFFNELIPANTMMPNRRYRLQMFFKLSTPPLIGIPGIAASFQFGPGAAFQLMSGAPLLGGVTNGLFDIDFRMVAQTDSIQIPFAKLNQPNGAIVNLSASAITPVGSFSADSKVDNNFTATLQFTGLSLGTSKLENFWTWRDAI
jgi:hypothetical protein